jgi:hypothetical protein
MVAAVLRFRLLDSRFSLFDRFLDTVVVALTLPNLLGPLRAVWRFQRGESLSSGEMLWAWVGIVWCWAGVTFDPHNRCGFLEGLAVHFIVLAGLTTLLATFGPRPPRRGKSWAHHAGWVILECDVVVWGLIAAPPP